MVNPKVSLENLSASYSNSLSKTHLSQKRNSIITALSLFEFRASVALLIKDEAGLI